ncbi:hypothetical protein D3C72_2013450 [compost metagenome]
MRIAQEGQLVGGAAGALHFGGVAQPQAGLADQVERDVGQRDILFQRGAAAAPFRQALAEHQRGIAQAQQVFELVVRHDAGRLRCA